MYKMHPNTVYFWRQVGKWLAIALIVVLVLFAIVGIASLFGSQTQYRTTDVKYSVGRLGFDDKSGGVIVEDDAKGSLVSDYIKCTGFYTEHGGDISADYQIWFYDADKNFVEVQEFNTGLDPAFYKGGVMPVRYADDEQQSVYVDDDGNVVVAEYIRIVLTPSSGETFDNFFMNWFKSAFVYKNVVELHTTQTPFSYEDIQEKVDDGVLTGVPLHPDKDSAEAAN